MNASYVRRSTISSKGGKRAQPYLNGSKSLSLMCSRPCFSNNEQHTLALLEREEVLRSLQRREPELWFLFVSRPARITLGLGQTPSMNRSRWLSHSAPSPISKVMVKVREDGEKLEGFLKVVCSSSDFLALFGGSSKRGCSLLHCYC